MAGVLIRGAASISILRVMKHLQWHVVHQLASIHRAKRVEGWAKTADRTLSTLFESDGEASGRVPARFDILPQAINPKL